MTALETPTAARDLQRRMRGAVIEPGGAGWEDATRAFNLASPRSRRSSRSPRTSTTSSRSSASRARTASRSRRSGPATTPSRSATWTTSILAQDRPPPRRRDRRRAARRARRARARSGRRSSRAPPSSASRRCTGRRRTSASPATRSAAGSAGTPASSASRRTASLAIELVTADGRLRRVDHEHDPELFWALRGGGGNFGVVTALEVQLYAIPEIYAGVLFFPWERSSEVLHAWLDWTRTVPDEVTSVGRILQFPPLPELPEPLRGQKFAVVEAVFIGERERGRGAARAAARARPGDGHVRDGAAGRALRAPHGPARARAVHRRGDDARRARRRRDRRVRRGRRARLRLAARLGRDPPPRRRAPPGERGHGALATFDSEFLTFGARDGVRRRDLPGEPEPARGAPRGADARTTRAASTSTSPRRRPTRRPSTARTPTGGSGP